MIWKRPSPSPANRVRVRWSCARRCRWRGCAGPDLEAAVAVAREQGARAVELRAALSLARLYQSTDSPLEAHDVLAPALEGFSPSPEFPEIEEAQTFLTATPETDEVRNAAAFRNGL